MKIPSKIKIIGRDIDIIFDKELQNKTNNVGEAHYRYGKIILQPNTDAKPMKEQEIDVTFLHEVIHIVLSMIESDKYDDEKFVGCFSEVLYQVLKDNKLHF